MSRSRALGLFAWAALLGGCRGPAGEPAPTAATAATSATSATATSSSVTSAAAGTATSATSGTAIIASATAAANGGPSATSAATSADGAGSCFLLYELGVGQVRRAPSDICGRRFSPASTFKIPHSLAALDAGVLRRTDEKIAYNGAAYAFPSWRADHTLSSAMRSSVVWYFQRIALRLGDDRELEYLRKLDYGNRDITSGLTTFWLGGSLLISPDEQQQFLIGLFEDRLPVSRAAMQSVRDILVQPQGLVVNSSGEHPFATPWPDGTVVSAKTGGSSDRSGGQVRWLVGNVRRQARSWIFVSCVAGRTGVEPMDAVDLAAQALRREGVL